MNQNDAKGCCGVCGLIVGVVLLIALLGAVIRLLPFLVIVGLVCLGVYLFNKHIKNSDHMGKEHQTGQYGNTGTWQQPPPAKPPISEKQMEDITVTIQDLEATDKTEKLKAMLEEDRR